MHILVSLNSFDITYVAGGSVCKVVYRSKENLEEIESNVSLCIFFSVKCISGDLSHWLVTCCTLSLFNTIFVSSHMYPENPEGTQVIVGSMNMGRLLHSL